MIMLCQPRAMVSELMHGFSTGHSSQKSHLLRSDENDIPGRVEYCIDLSSQPSAHGQNNWQVVRNVMQARKMLRSKGSWADLGRLASIRQSKYLPNGE